MTLFQYNVKIEKGDYSIILQIRHEKKDQLEKLKEMGIVINDTIFNHIITVDYSITHLTYLSFGKGPTKIGYNSSLSIVADVIFLLLTAFGQVL
jgi:hypothetical protein